MFSCLAVVVVVVVVVVAASNSSAYKRPGMVWPGRPVAVAQQQQHPLLIFQVWVFCESPRVSSDKLTEAAVPRPMRNETKQNGIGIGTTQRRGRRRRRRRRHSGTGGGANSLSPTLPAWTCRRGTEQAVRNRPPQLSAPHHCDKGLDRKKWGKNEELGE
ncbi:hypothetical protein IWX48DRAFT_77547 [Phyllosticta citricarpa]